jgi:hypothetical protein
VLDQPGLRAFVAGANTLHDRCSDPRFLLQRRILPVQWYYLSTCQSRSRFA